MISHQESGSAQKWLLPACIAAYSLATLSWWAQPELFHALLRGLAFNESTTGYVVAIEIFAVAVTSFILAPRIAVLPLRTVCVAGALVAIAAHGISIYLEDFAVLLLVRGLAGVGEGCALAIANALIATTAHPDRAYGKMNMLSVAIGASFLALIPILETRYAHVGVFAGLLIVNLILLPFLMLLPRREAPEISSVQLDGDRKLAAALLLPAVLLWSIGAATLWALVIVLGMRTDLEPETIGITVGALSFASAFGSGLVVWLDTRFGRLRPLFVGMAIHAVAIFLLVHSTSAVIFIVAGAFKIAGSYFVFTYMLGLGAAIDRSGGCSAAVAGMFILAGGIGPAIGGELVQLTGSYSVLGWTMIFAAIVAFAMMSYVDRLISNPSTTAVTT